MSTGYGEYAHIQTNLRIGGYVIHTILLRRCCEAVLLSSPAPCWAFGVTYGSHHISLYRMFVGTVNLQQLTTSLQIIQILASMLSRSGYVERCRLSRERITVARDDLFEFTNDAWHLRSVHATEESLVWHKYLHFILPRICIWFSVCSQSLKASPFCKYVYTCGCLCCEDLLLDFALL